MTACLFFFSFLSSALLFANGDKRMLQARRTGQVILIDGILNEDAWRAAEMTTGFTQLAPNPGMPASNRTEVRVLYDDVAIYVGVMLYDQPDLIGQALFERDNINAMTETDWFGVAFDTYMDGINGFAFIISPAGVQSDVKFSAEGDDKAWDAVWHSAVTIDDEGWIAELRIPYSALRFPDVEEQRWHIQFGRSTFRNQEEAFWNPVNPEVNGFLTQAGILAGLKEIKSPVRLSLSPFLAVYEENYFDKNETPESTWGHTINGGMDVKYGISDAFTLDMTLIPDFGQVQSDNAVLNLSPFEVRFDENRQFFTEGTELFNKGGLFYSRRVGGVPIFKEDVEDALREGESVRENPVQSQLYNATKISGRTAKGLGIGFFNAVGGRAFATIAHEDGSERKFLTTPLTNYNVVVFDQNLKNNSYITLINTNVWRSGRTYDANVTGTQCAFRDKENIYGIAGGGAVSHKFNPGKDETGHFYRLEIGKKSGNLLWEAGYREESDTYDPNDMGFLFNNNARELYGWMEYNVWEPFGNFLRMGAGGFIEGSWLYRFPGEEERMYRDNLFTRIGVNMWWWTTTKKFLRYQFWTYFEPARSFDYFEPRVDGYFLERPAFCNVGFRFNTDNRKRLILGLEGRYKLVDENGMHEKGIEIEPRLRISDKFSLSYNLYLAHEKNDMGYVTDFDAVEIIIGKRNVTNTINLIQANYTFNPLMHLSFRLRHNWTRVGYQSFHALLDNGNLAPSNYAENEDINFNAFTIDAVFRWRFAPGSDIFIVWKNGIIGEQEQSEYDYFENLGHLFDNPMRNSLSLKVLYFIDYLDIQKKYKRSG